MAHTIVESGATFPATLTMPDNGDNADAAFLETLLQALANRTDWLKALCTVGGVPRLAYVADIASLQAIDVSTVGTNDIRIIEGVGVFTYDSARSDAANSPWIVQPTIGAGRWINSGAVRPSKKVIVDEQLYTDASTNTAHYYGTSTSWVDLTTPAQISFTCLAGDEIDIDAVCQLFCDGGASNVGRARIAVVDGGTTIGLGESVAQAWTKTNELFTVPMHGRYTVVNAGTVTVKIQAQAGAGTYNVGVNSAIVLRGTQKR